MRLWSFELGLAAFLVALFAGFAAPLASRLPVKIAKPLMAIALIFSIYSIANGLYALQYWEWIDLQGEAAEQGTRTPRKGGLVLLAISLWPLMCIGIGGLGTWLYWMAFRDPELMKRIDQA